MKNLRAYMMLPVWWLANVGAALSQLLSAFFGGDPDETVSSRLGKARAKGEAWAEPFCKALDMVHEDHCAKSAIWDKDEGGRSLRARLKEALETKS